MPDKKYDYAIVGAGAAGLNLSLAFINDPHFRDKSFIILEKSQKNLNDRTWCFWEQENTTWDKIATKTWQNGDFFSKKGEVHFNTEPYQYKMLRSIDFYNYAIGEIRSAENFNWINEDVDSISTGNNSIVIKTDSSEYKAGHVFDSRIDPGFKENRHSYLNVLQHFKGWVIETDTNTFDPERFVMMDYRMKWKDTTSFMYLLPISERRALIEFTFFSPDLVEEEVYDQMMDKYLKEEFNLETYKVKESEIGVIPMSNFPFHKVNTEYITKIGTAGGWVRPSSGYSFKNAERYSQEIIKNIKQDRVPSQGIANNRFRKYDTLFLELLQNRNEMGEDLFYTMYTKNKVDKIFKFLDEQTSFTEDLRIMNSFNPLPFMSAFIKNFRSLIFN